MRGATNTVTHPPGPSNDCDPEAAVGPLNDAGHIRLWGRRADLLRALAHPVRLRILALLSDGERCVCKIYPALACERTVTSKHLAVLRRAGVVDCRREGLRIFYRLCRPCLAGLVPMLDELLVGAVGGMLDDVRPIVGCPRTDGCR